VALPRGWDETAGEWRVRLRAPGRFVRIRPKPLEGVKGVYMVGGPLKRGDREHGRHAGGAFVPQALRFKKTDWPSLTAAVGWFQASRFAGGELDNPPKGSLPQIERAYNEGYNNGRIDKSIGHRSDYAFTPEPSDSLEHSDSGVRWRTAYTMGYRDGWNGAARRRSFNPPRRRRGEKIERKTVRSDFWIESATSEELAADPSSPYRMVTTGGQRFGLSVLDAIRAQKEGLEYRGRGTPPALEENPPPIRRGQLRLGSFRAGVDAAIEKLVTTETELNALMVQALELVDRGAPVPAWIRERARGLHLERTAQLEAVRTAVARHGAVLEELAPSSRRRGNPSGDRRAAAELYRTFHGGAAPRDFHFEQIPDLSQLVHLGRALRVDYQAARPRGSTNTPYRHEFDSGSELFTDRTGRALVILGNLKVSRAPRGRFGYIRAGAR
jgi:hypothetical protein